MNDKMTRPSMASNLSQDITPVPPPPPVISKPVSPDGFDNVPPPANYPINRPKPVSPIFSNPEPTPVPRPIPTLAPPIIPPVSTFESAQFRVPEPVVERLPVHPSTPNIGHQVSIFENDISVKKKMNVGKY